MYTYTHHYTHLEPFLLYSVNLDSTVCCPSLVPRFLVWDMYILEVLLKVLPRVWE